MTNEKVTNTNLGSLPPGDYTPIYLCESAEGPVGWTFTADQAVEWAMSTREPRLVKITKLYEIKTQN